MTILFGCHGNIKLKKKIKKKLNDSSTKTTVNSVAKFITSYEESIKPRLPFSNLLFLKAIFFTFIVFSCPFAVYMYKIMILLNNSSETT